MPGSSDGTEPILELLAGIQMTNRYPDIASYLGVVRSRLSATKIEVWAGLIGMRPHPTATDRDFCKHNTRRMPASAAYLRTFLPTFIALGHVAETKVANASSVYHLIRADLEAQLVHSAYYLF